MASIKDIAHNAINKIPGIGRPQPGSLKKYLADSYKKMAIWISMEDLLLLLD